MKTLNLIHLDKSDIKYQIFTYPDGELHIKLEGFDKKSDVKVITRVTSSNELFILMQVADILNRYEINWNCYITYLMSQRVDRVKDLDEAVSLKIVTNIIHDLGASYVEILELYNPHYKGIANSNVIYNVDIGDIDWNNPTFSINSSVCRCFLSAEAQGRYNWAEAIILSKKNKNGEISLEFEKEPNHMEQYDTICVLNDICNTGDTFVKAAELLKEKYPDKKLIVYVVHSVNLEGIKSLSKNYDMVNITNSYRDWKNLPSNVKVTDVCC